MENLDEQILEKLQMDWSWAEIAEMYHVGNNRISRIAKENGIVKKKSRQKTFKETLQTLDKRIVPCAFSTQEIELLHDAIQLVLHPKQGSYQKRAFIGRLLFQIMLKMNEVVNR